MMNADELTEAVRSARSEIEMLRVRLDELQNRTNLISQSFLKRAFAVLGHYMVSSLMIAIPFYVLLFIIIIVAGLAGR